MVVHGLPTLYRRRPARCLDCGSWPCGRAEHPTHYRRSPEADRFRYLSATSAPNATASAALRPTTRFRWMAAIKLNPKALSLGPTCLKPSSSAGMLTESFDLFAGHHNGYAPVIHHRWVFGLKNPDSGWSAISSPATGPPTRDRRGASTTSKSTGTFWRNTTWSFCLQLATIGPNQSSASDWSPVYGKKEPAFVRRFSTEAIPTRRIHCAVDSRRTRCPHPNRARFLSYKEPQGSRHEFIFGERLRLSRDRCGGDRTMKLLWVKAGGLLPPDMGGKIRSYNILKQLAKRHEITLFTFYQEHPGDQHLRGDRLLLQYRARTPAASAPPQLGRVSSLRSYDGCRTPRHRR